MRDPFALAIVIGLLAVASCDDTTTTDGDGDGDGDADVDGDGDADIDGDGDADIDGDGDADGDGDWDTDEDSGMCGDCVCRSPRAEPWRRREQVAPGSVVFSELLYRPRYDEGLEWIELHNPMALDMDLSGWRLERGVTYTFAEGTILPAGGFLVVAADPELLAREMGVMGALGPYEDRLSDGGERIDLRSNGGRLIDTMEYDDREPWTVLPVGSGLSLAKVDHDSASDRAENWTASVEIGGTPGLGNFPDHLAPPATVDLVETGATWSYDASGRDLEGGWTLPDYDDSGWELGETVFFAGVGHDDVTATARFTADDFYAVYLGGADGTGLRFVGPDPLHPWTIVEEFDIEVTSGDHLFVAAWEAPGDSSPQMVIGEVDLPFGILGTGVSTFERVLGPTGACPGDWVDDPPPAEEALAGVIRDADARGAWAAPSVEMHRTGEPWGSSVGEFFADEARYIWADTFDNVSVTNTENTYVLFRSRDPLHSLGSATELTSIPTTVTFRTDFVFGGDPTRTELTLDGFVDDGAIYYLNGVEVLRQNMPEGPVDAGTLATEPVDDPSFVHAELPTAALVRGLNVLAVEVHQAEPDDSDLTFGCALSATISPGLSERAPTLILNEVAASAADPFWVELLNVDTEPWDTGGLALFSSRGEEADLPGLVLEPGELLVLDDIGFSPRARDVLFLGSSDGSEVLDGVTVQEGLRGRVGLGGGPWRYPREATPGEENVIDVTEDVVINEIQYHHPPLSREGEPVRPRRLEWLELYNRGTEAVDLGGWQLVDAVAFEFPRGTTIGPGAYLVVAEDMLELERVFPGVPMTGDYSGRLDNKSDRILLLDACGNPADEVRYFDGGRWPEAADGGGSSLELRNPWADNAAPEAWAASDEARRSEWSTYSYRGVAEPSAVGPDGTWEELVVGLLDAGEVLLDDLSVVESPESVPVELLQNGDFERGGESWRLLGTHRHSAVIPDPDDPSNQVLHLVATGPTEHMHNHVETTLLRPVSRQEYEISFRARWISGSNQLNTRLYFNRLPRTTLVAQPEVSGTPGERNSTSEDNLGPTFDDLRHEPAVPPPFERVRVTISTGDPDGLEEVTLWVSVDGAPFEAQEMTELGSRRWEGWLEGQPAASVVQIYVEAEDRLGARATFPAAGPDSRALIQFDDGLAATSGLHNFRFIMTRADSDWMHQTVNIMSNDLLGATVVYDEGEVFYDVGVRTRGSMAGRPLVARLGYYIRFHSEQPFRGSLGSAILDRSEVVGGHGQREVLQNLVMTHAGSVSGEYNDLTQAIAPRRESSGSAELQLDRFTNLMLASQFADGDDGTVYQYEMIYYPLTTDDGTPEGLKLPLPRHVVGTHIRYLGEDPELYRWNYLIESNERLDDYTGVIELGRAFSLSGPEFLDQVGSAIDVDQWLRAFAFSTLCGAVDQYPGAGSQHNAKFYVRPEDGRVLLFPHDQDFYRDPRLPVVNNGDLRRLLASPANRRTYYGHLYDIIERAYNGEYMAHWRDQLTALLPGQDFAGHWRFIVDRSEWVLRGAPEAVMTAFPPLDFRITTNDGADLSVPAPEVVLEGEAWIDVRQIALAGEAEPLEVTWVDGRTWQVTVPLEPGPNDVTLVAMDLHGAPVATATIGVTSTGE